MSSRKSLRSLRSRKSVKISLAPGARSCGNCARTIDTDVSSYQPLTTLCLLRRRQELEQQCAVRNFDKRRGLQHVALIKPDDDQHGVGAWGVLAGVNVPAAVAIHR